MLRKHYGTFGFTLVELLITIAVLSILIVVAVVVLDPVTRFEEARISNAKSAMNDLAEAVEVCYAAQQFKADPGGYSDCDSLSELKAGGFLKSGFTLPINMSYSRSNPTSNWFKKFIRNSTNDTMCIMFWHGPENQWQSYISARGKLDFGYTGAECPGSWSYFP